MRDSLDIGALSFAPIPFLAGDLVRIRAAIDDARHAVAEFFADFIEPREATLVLDGIMQQRSNDFVFTAAALNDDGRNSEQVSNVRLALPLATLVKMELGSVTKRFHKTIREHRLFDDGLTASQVFRLSPARRGKQAEEFQIQPDQRDHQAKCAVPLHVFRRSALDAAFDHVKIENQIQSRDDHYKEAEADSHGTAAVDHRNLKVEKTAKNHFHEIEKRDAAGGGNHA